jgi:hypothetical protein
MFWLKPRKIPKQLLNEWTESNLHRAYRKKVVLVVRLLGHIIHGIVRCHKTFIKYLGMRALKLFSGLNHSGIDKSFAVVYLDR